MRAFMPALVGNLVTNLVANLVAFLVPAFVSALGADFDAALGAGAGFFKSGWTRNITSRLPMCCTGAASRRVQISVKNALRVSRSAP